MVRRVFLHPDLLRLLNDVADCMTSAGPLQQTEMLSYLEMVRDKYPAQAPRVVSQIHILGTDVSRDIPASTPLWDRSEEMPAVEYWWKEGS